MSVWKKFQRVGKQAAKFQFNASYSELKLETNGFQPDFIVISWMHRNRKYASKPIKLIPVPTSPNNFSYVWEIQDNVEIVTTLYKMKKETVFEEKDWTFQLDDVREDGTRRRVLAYRNINIAQYADRFPTQHSIKICFKLSSKKIKSATLFLTLSSVFLKEGDATDDDMISVASLMSIPSNPQFSNSISIPNSDIARLSDLDDLNMSLNDGDNGLEIKSDVKGQIAELCDQIGQFDMNESIIEEDEDQDFSPKIVERGKDHIKDNSPSTPNAKTPTNSPQQNPFLQDQETSQSENRQSTVSTITTNDSTLDLLNWSKDVTKSYSNVTINNYTTSFRNGIAFCAIIHHYKPDLIGSEIETLNPSQVKQNNRLAFNAASLLGIPKVLDPNEMAILKVPDPLSIMTYLHQLRTHFTGEDIVCTPASLGANHNPRTDTGKHSSPNSYQKMYGVQDNTHFPEFSDTSNPTNSPKLEAKINTSRNEISQSNEANQKENHISKSDRMNPFLETEEVTEIVSLSPPTKEKSLKKISPKKQKFKLASFNIDGTIKEEKSLSEKKVKKINLGKLSMLSADPSGENKTSSANGRAISNSQPNSPQTIRSSNNVSNNHAPVTSPQQSHNLYLSAEVSALEKEQESIDEQANVLERQLRAAMNSKDGETKTVLLAKWFDLVNKKNALIRRNMQLQILEKEQNLETKWSLLQNELRQILSVEEYNKTDEMRRREELLMKDLIDIVNQRDNVVNELDKYEQGLAAEIEFARQNPEVMNANCRTLATANYKDKNCLVM